MTSRAGRSPEAGVTLVELLIYLVISGVVLSGMTAIALGTYRTSQRVDVSVSDGLQAQTAIAVMTRDLRATAPVRPSDIPAFEVARPFEARFTANIDTITDPVLITIRLEDDGRVVEEFVLPNGTLPAAGWDTDNPNVRYITSFVVNDPADPAGQAMIRYFDRNGNELGPNPGNLTAQERRAIEQVELSLLVSGDPNQNIGRYAVQSRVRLPNADGQVNLGDDDS